MMRNFGQKALAALMVGVLTAQLAALLLLHHPARFSKVIIAGVGASYFDPTLSEGGTNSPERRAVIADALVAPDPSAITDPTARQFRAFADQAGKDRVALAACMRGNRDSFTREELGRATRPVLVVCGENDVITGAPGPLAEAFPDGRAVIVPRRDHMTAVGDKVYKQAVLDFIR